MGSSGFLSETKCGWQGLREGTAPEKVCLADTFHDGDTIYRILATITAIRGETEIQKIRDGRELWEEDGQGGTLT